MQPVPNDPATTAAAGSPVQLVSTPDAGVPSAGATNVLFEPVLVEESVHVPTPLASICVCIADVTPLT